MAIFGGGYWPFAGSFIIIIIYFILFYFILFYFIYYFFLCVGGTFKTGYFLGLSKFSVFFFGGGGGGGGGLGRGGGIVRIGVRTFRWTDSCFFY